MDSTGTLTRRALRDRALAYAAVFTTTAAAFAQTHCHLRDPERSVFQAYPQSDGYRAIVRPVDDAARSYVERTLPFRVHFDELGEHTLYVALREREPVGLIYVRTEESEWGLTEIAWHLDLELRIAGFKFHRCRSRYAKAIEGSNLAKALVGLDFEHVAELLNRSGNLSKAAPPVPWGSEKLAATVVRSAAKALLIIDSVWNSEIDKLCDIALGLSAFPGADRFDRLVTVDVEPAAPAGERAPSRLRHLRAVRAGVARRVTGIAVEVQMKLAENWERTRWSLDQDGTIAKATAKDSTASAALQKSLAELHGKNLHELAATNDLQRAALELSRRLQSMHTVGRH